MRLERAALDTAIFSGKLFLLDGDALEKLYENYRRIDVVNRNSDDLRAIARRPVTKEYVPMIESLATVTTGYMKNLQDSIPAAIKKLEQKL